MDRRRALGLLSLLALGTGCRGYQFGHVIKPDAANMVGSHKAGAEVFDPLIDEAVGQLLAAECGPHPDMPPVAADGTPLKKTICFIGVENKSSEDLGDFKDQIYQQIDAKIRESNTFAAISRRMVDAALYETRLRPDSLYIPDNMRLFTAVLERQGQPMDYLMYATLTSGTTKRNNNTQRDYLLTLELVNVNTGVATSQAAEIRKGYHKTRAGAWWNYNPFASNEN